MSIYHEDILDIELNTGTIARTFLSNSIGEGDDMANRYGVRLFRGGEPVSAEDSEVIGLFMAPDGVNYLISETTYTGSTGTSGNIAWVQLPDDCYVVEGQFSLAIKLGGGSVVGTMRIVDGVVTNTGSTGAVAPTGSIPSSAEIIAAFEEAVELIDGVVRHDVSQSLDSTSKGRARGNIGAASQADMETEIALRLLEEDEIPDTTQTPSFNSSGDITQIVHSQSGTTIRTDVFTFATGLITEVRTLNTGAKLTIVTNLTTLVTTTTYTAA